MRSFPPSLTAKVKESLQTLGNVGDPKLKIAVSRAKTTVTDANYWTVETIRDKAGLGDVSIAPRRLFKNYGGPDRLYEIHIDNGEVLTSLREYPDKLKQGWQPQFSLGLGSAVAIAFDGEWELYRKVWRLRTHEVPWIFWVDSLGDLYAQLWSDETTRVLLASGVDGSKGVKAIRGWKELNQGLNDQGLVIAYVKMDGTVAYRNYCIQSDLTYIWETERTVTGFTGTAQGLGLFLTNDYRLGFTVNTSLGDIWWMVTHRTWVGMATTPDNIIAGIGTTTVEVIPIKEWDTYSDDEYLFTGIGATTIYVCEDGIIPAIISTERLSFADKKTIKINFNYPLECDLINLKANLVIQDTILQSYEIDELIEDGNSLTIKTVNEMVFTKDITVLYSAIGSYFLAFRISSTCLYDYGNLIDLKIVGIPPDLYINDFVTARTQSTITVRQVYYRYGYTGSDYLNVGLGNTTITVTKVGSNPL